MNEKRPHPSSMLGDDDSDGSAPYSPSMPDDENNGGREYSIPVRSLRMSHADLHAHGADMSQALASDQD
jgi:hypothetical protein